MDYFAAAEKLAQEVLQATELEAAKQRAAKTLAGELIEADKNLGKGAKVASGRSSNKIRDIEACNVNARDALDQKLRALKKAQEKAQEKIFTVKELPDGRIRYYDKERPSKTVGPTRGSSQVTEYNPKTGQVRTWGECYDHAGNVNRVHPKMINGIELEAQYYALTKAEIFGKGK